MTKSTTRRLSRAALLGSSSLALMLSTAYAEQAVEFKIKSGSLVTALNEYARQSDQEILFSSDIVAGKEAKAVNGVYEPQEALEMILADTGLVYAVDDGDTVLIKDPTREVAAPRSFRMAQLDQEDAVWEANGQDEDEETVHDTIIVTGTNIRGIAPASSPSIVLDRDAIDRTGYSTTAELIQSLPQNFSGGSNITIPGGESPPNDPAAGSNVNFGSSVNLRGLGSGSTLVLLNGTRLAPGGNIGDFVDISMIPLSAIERVEILTDGASAIYGADAIAGVVNFVLRDDYDGAETFVRYGTVTEGNLDEYSAGYTIGKNWSAGNALVSYEFLHRDSLDVSEKDFSSMITSPNEMLPRQESHSAIASVSQEVGERVTLRGFGAYTKRDGRRDRTNAFGTTRTITDVEQYGANGRAAVELPKDWLLDISGGYNKQSSFLDNQGPFPDTVVTESDLWSIDAKADGPILSLPGGDIKLAVGVGYRQESFSNSFSGSEFRQANRDVFSSFGEVFVPLVGEANRVSGIERLEITLAGRYDDFSDFDDTFNPKIGLLWSPLAELNLRGTYSESFNPPNLGDIGVIDGGAAITSIAPNPASGTGVSLVLIDARTNRGLRPETSTAWTAGLDFNSNIYGGNFHFSATWFRISFEDRISQADANPFNFLNDPDVFGDVIIADPDPTVAAQIISEVPSFLNFDGGAWAAPGDEEFILDFRLLNLSAVETDGVDFNVSYSKESDLGQIGFGLNANYLFKLDRQITSSAPVFDAVSTVFNPVDFRLRGNASWSSNGWSVSTFVNYSNNYVDNRNIGGTGDVSIDSWVTVDLNLSYDFGENINSAILSNTKFSLSGLNILNEDPPSVADDGLGGSIFGYDSTNASPLGRFVAFQVTKSW